MAATAENPLVIQPFTQGFTGVWFGIYHRTFPGHELGGFLNLENEDHRRFLGSLRGRGGDGDGDGGSVVILPEKDFNDFVKEHRGIVGLTQRAGIQFAFIREILYPIHGGIPRWYHIPFSPAFIQSVQEYIEGRGGDGEAEKKVVVVYHGTGEESVSKILEEGFRETSKESGMMGGGIYFGDYWKASRYGFRSSDYSKIPAGFRVVEAAREAVIPLDDILFTGEFYDSIRMNPCVIRCVIFPKKTYEFPNDDVIRKLEIPIARLQPPALGEDGVIPKTSGFVSWKTHSGKPWRGGGGVGVSKIALDELPVFRGVGGGGGGVVYIIVSAPLICSLASVYGEIIARRGGGSGSRSVIISETLIREAMPDFKRNMELSIESSTGGGLVHPDFLEKCEDHLEVLKKLVEAEAEAGGDVFVSFFPRRLDELESLVSGLSKKRVVIVHVDAMEPTDDVLEFGGKTPNPSYILATLDSRKQMRMIENVRGIVERFATGAGAVEIQRMMCYPRYHAFQYKNPGDLLKFGLNHLGIVQMTTGSGGSGGGRIVPIQYMERSEMYDSHSQEYQPWNHLRLLRLSPSEQERRVGMRLRQKELLNEVKTGADAEEADCIILKPFRFEYYNDAGTRLYKTGSLSTRLEVVLRGEEVIVMDWGRLRLGSSPRNHIPIQGYGFVY